MSLDLRAYQVTNWELAVASFNRGADGGFFDELAEDASQWGSPIPNESEWQPNNHLWQYVGAALDRIVKETKRPLPNGLDAIRPFVGEQAEGRRMPPFLDESTFFVALNPEGTKEEAIKFYNIDFRLLRLPYYDLAKDDEYPWDQIEQWGDFADAFLPYLLQWRNLFINTARIKKGVLVTFG